jgi:hypothetical protein
MMIGAHLLLYSTDADADRAFIRDVLSFAHVDVGGGWLIFALPPAEVAVHPGTGGFSQEHSGHKMISAVLYLMCDDVRAQVKALEAKGIACADIEQERWGLRTAITLPSGGQLGLYQPTHPTAFARNRA